MTKIKEYTLKNGEKRYKFVLYAGIDENTGKKKNIQKTGFRSRKAAQVELTRLEYQKDNRELLNKPLKSVTFDEVAADWFATYKLTVRESTLANTNSRYRTHIAPFFGAYKVDKVTLRQCQAAVNSWFVAVPSSMPACISLTAAILDLARKQGYILVNPMKDVTRPRRRKVQKDNNFYSREELGQFLKAVKKTENKKIYACFRLLAYSGIRKGELLALTWGDVDFKEKALNIDKSLTNGLTGFNYVDKPKTAASIRTLALDDVTLSILLEWKHDQAKELLKLGCNANKPQQIIFDDGKGGIIPHKNTVNRWLNRIYQKNPNLRRIRVHGFRHTHCTLLLESGASLQATRERLGHSDISTTLNFYTHVTNKTRNEAIKGFLNYMQG